MCCEWDSFPFFGHHYGRVTLWALVLCAFGALMTHSSTLANACGLSAYLMVLMTACLRLPRCVLVTTGLLAWTCCALNFRDATLNNFAHKHHEIIWTTLDVLAGLLWFVNGILIFMIPIHKRQQIANVSREAATIDPTATETNAVTVAQPTIEGREDENGVDDDIERNAATAAAAAAAGDDEDGGAGDDIERNAATAAAAAAADDDDDGPVVVEIDEENPAEDNDQENVEQQGEQDAIP